ncbi:MAG: hemerythrin family protein [Bacteroidetes bacterium]|nr:hemerythrin family protein [Bacteroidota bacterium]
MSVTIKWIPSYSVQHAGIDEQHQQLFQLIDDLPDTIDPLSLKKCIIKLFKYTRTHFSDEEEIMKSIGYPGRENHQKLHEDLISELTEFSEREFSDEKCLQDLKEFAYNWLTDHIIDEDMNYYRFAKENNIVW